MDCCIRSDFTHQDACRVISYRPSISYPARQVDDDDYLAIPL